MGSTLALLTRSLRVSSRQLRTYTIAFLLVAGVLWTMAWSHQTSDIFGAPGLRFFSWMTSLNFYFISLAAASYFSTSITEEKEEMTLGLLKMAGVNPVSILLGKSSPRMITSMLLLTIQFPFILLAITLGGVTFHQVFAAYCTLLAYLALTANIGLFTSVVFRRSNTASFVTGTTLVAYFVALPLLNFALTVYLASGNGNFVSIVSWLQQEVFTPLLSMSAYQRKSQILITGFADPAIGTQVISNLIGAGVFFFLSWLAFEKCTENEKPAAPTRGMLSFRGKPRIFGAGRTWPMAMVWKDFFFVAGGFGTLIAKWIFYGIVMVGFYILFVFLGSQWGNFKIFDAELLGNTLMISMLIVIMVEIPFLLGRSLRDELQWRTLQTLAILPSPLPQVGYEKYLGALLGLIPAAGYFCLGVLVNAGDFVGAFAETVTSTGGWYSILSYLFFVQVCVFLSAFMKWGALPLAFVIMIGYNSCLFGMLGLLIPRAGEGVFGVVGFITAFITVVLHIATWARLDAASSK